MKAKRRVRGGIIPDPQPQAPKPHRVLGPSPIPFSPDDNKTTLSLKKIRRDYVHNANQASREQLSLETD